ncbi:hypothetical protein N7G274_005811 [Stereocaulon virgatum]|uniref:Uncharacterized protein n=1 Tax=Stereocaulon virgatum TaxID=373712 RepID=A0ABR4A6A3_9LECA
MGLHLNGKTTTGLTMWGIYLVRNIRSSCLMSIYPTEKHWHEHLEINWISAVTILTETRELLWRQWSTRKPAVQNFYHQSRSSIPAFRCSSLILCIILRLAEDLILLCTNIQSEDWEGKISVWPQRELLI